MSLVFVYDQDFVLRSRQVNTLNFAWKVFQTCLGVAWIWEKIRKYVISIKRLTIVVHCRSSGWYVVGGGTFSLGTPILVIGRERQNGVHVTLF